MNGWADVFQTTPVNGLHDQFLSAGYSAKIIPGLDATKLEGQYHGYNATKITQNYGNEIDLNLEQSFLSHYMVGVEYTNYEANYKHSAVAVNTQKVIVSAQAKF